MPVVLSLSAAEQRAFAATAGSPLTTTAAPTTTTTTAAPPSLQASGIVYTTGYCPTLVTITGTNTNFDTSAPTNLVTVADVTNPSSTFSIGIVSVTATQVQANVNWTSGGANGDTLSVTVKQVGGSTVTGGSLTLSTATPPAGFCGD